MAQRIGDVMTKNVTKLPASASVADAARKMREEDIGAVVIEDERGGVCLVTDRDIAIRVVAESMDPKQTRLGDVCSRDVVSVSPDDDADRAVEIMRQRAIRRIPVVDAGRVVGIVSLGDLARNRDRTSVLGQISSAAPTR